MKINIKELEKLGFKDDSASFAEGHLMYSYYFDKFDVVLVVDLDTNELFLQFFDPSDKKETLNISLASKIDINNIKEIIKSISQNTLNIKQVKNFSTKLYNIRVFDQGTHKMEVVDSADSKEEAEKLKKSYEGKFGTGMVDLVELNKKNFSERINKIFKGKQS